MGARECRDSAGGVAAGAPFSQLRQTFSSAQGRRILRLL
jgi:hypothetical protein